MITFLESAAGLWMAKATVVVAFGLMAAAWARRSRAAVLHALLAATFGVLLILPVASLIAPPLRIVGAASSIGSFAAGAESRTGAGAAVAAAQEASRMSMATLLAVGWGWGVAIALLPMLAGLWQMRGLRRSAEAWPQGQAVADSLAQEAGMRRKVAVLRHATLAGPMTSGVLHPAILLPADAKNWSAEDLERAMVHELEHVRRGDPVTHCLARAACAVYWFHPLVWMAWRKLALEAERSCDDVVLGRSEATAYADQLVGLARRFSTTKAPLLAMANRKDLSARVGALLDGTQSRGRAGKATVMLAGAAGLVLVLGLAPLRMAGAPQPVSTDSMFLSTTRLVTETVTVSDRNGKNIEGFQAGDFAVTEDGVAQSISVFEFQKSYSPDGISSYYVLGYYPKNSSVDEAMRNVNVVLKQDPNAKLTFRLGYRASRFFAVAVPRAGAAQEVNVRPVASDVTPPKLLRKVEPEYSEEARKAKFQGVVTLGLDIDASGQVIAVQVLRPLGLGLDEKAVAAVRQWKFSPAMKSGAPVAAQTQVEMRFQLL